MNFNLDNIGSFYDLFKPPPVPQPGEVTPYSGEGVSRYGAAALERECEAVAHAPEGTRNDTLNRASFNLSQLIASGHLNQEHVHSKLTNAALAAGLDAQEVQRTLASGYRAGTKLPRAVQELPVAEVHVLRPPEGLAGQSVPEAGAEPDAAGDGTEEEPDARDVGVEPWVRKNLPAVDWWALWEEDEEEEWILEPVIPARRLVALYSPPKVGKSLLMLELAAAIATGRPVLGAYPDQPRRVLYVDFENDPRGDVRPRLEAMGYGPDDLDGLSYLTFPALSALDTERGGMELMAAVAVYKADLVVIDTVSRAVAGEENDNDTWLKFYRCTGVLLKAAGVACVRLDHAGKDAGKGQRGGSAKAGDVDLIWRLTYVTETLLSLVCEANRLPVPQKVVTFERRLEPRLHSYVPDAGRRPTPEAAVDAVVRRLDELDAPLDVGRPTAERLLRDAGWKGDSRLIQRAVRVRKLAGVVPLMPLSPELLSDLSGTQPLTPDQPAGTQE